MSTFLLEIVTPERKVYAEQVNMIVVKGVAGDLGILPHHIPMVTPLKIAPVHIKQGSTDLYIAVSGGFMEVGKDKVIILAESAELPGDIDVERAKVAKTRAESRLNDKATHIDFHRAELAMQKALMRINVSEKRF
ncbi:F0F1 ATP synthase subunit epsilon [Paenibacillus psychroresistens]|uniref:ATP synthase epsilon chain n=1 Tax=Paenibacillus psychroresistens TaxID=1778678 RepID=A0A6B8RDD3_9BACL|nr:F0F1 ATP synthase subunit epsilon [Paenibacillus psychroresistens]QGQ93478.1 F0F1 ATP synthase subunit epsilon [Paenibacillus psychroresistens]